MMERSKVFKGVYAAVVLMVVLALTLSLMHSTDAVGIENARTPAPLYVIKAEQNRIGVYAVDSDEVQFYLDTPVGSLPEYDQDVLYDGIPVYSEEELEERIQDFDG